ncbi:MAG: MBL fold metallo-hydrolase [Calditrichia bacterium]
MAPIRIKFWGVRGSIPTPGPRTLRYGGNTSCVEIRFPDMPPFIVDAGTGIRELAKEMEEKPGPHNAYIFLSHFHWDHIQGLPFFKPAFVPGNKFVVFGCDEPSVDLSNIISMQMNPIYFPVAVDDMAARMEFRSILESEFDVEGVHVQTKFLNHPGYTLGFRFNYKGKSVVYISDNEPYRRLDDQNEGLFSGDSLEDRFENFADNKEEELINFISETDLLIHDTQYFPEEYKERVSWGHSPYTYSCDIARKGRVKQLILFHHDPDHDDDTIDRLEAQSRERLKKHNYAIPCNAAQEGSIIEI